MELKLLDLSIKLKSCWRILIFYWLKSNILYQRNLYKMVISQNFMDNRSLVEEVYNFQKGIKNKNPILALSISNTFLPLLEYRRHLEQASKEDLLSLKGIGHSSVDYLLRI